MPVLVNLKPYLAELTLTERAKPVEQRRPVPTLADLAEAVGMHPISFLRIANNQVKMVNLETADKILREMNRRGFRMDVPDLLVWRT